MRLRPYPTGVRRSPYIRGPRAVEQSRTTKKDVFMSAVYRNKQTNPTQLYFNFSSVKVHKLIRTRTVSGNLPNWRQRIINGGDATTGLAGQYDRLWLGGGSSTVHWWNPTTSRFEEESWSGNKAGYDLPTLLSSDPTLEIEAEKLAVARFNKKASKYHTVMQGGVFLGEIREALDMLRNPLHALMRGLGDYLVTVDKRNRILGKKSRKLTKRQASKRLSKIAADTWLESVFGWLPFFSDVADAVKAYQSLSRKHETIEIGSGGQAEKLLFRGESTGAEQNYLYYKTVHQQKQRTHIKYRGALRITAGTYQGAEVMDRFGLNFRNFIPTAWELIPWSFLADYWSNMGDILSYDNTVNQDLAWLLKGVGTTVTQTLQIVPDIPKMNSLIVNGKRISGSGSSSYAVREHREVSRNPQHGLPILDLGDLTLSVPDYWKQMANMFALLTSSASGVHPQNFRR